MRTALLSFFILLSYVLLVIPMADQGVIRVKLNLLPCGPKTENFIIIIHVSVTIVIFVEGRTDEEENVGWKIGKKRETGEECNDR